MGWTRAAATILAATGCWGPLAAPQLAAQEITTVYTARNILTMEPSQPTATAVAVQHGEILSVGDLESLAPWLEGRDHRIDHRYSNAVLMPGLIDNHLHPLMAALLLPMVFITPEPWELPRGAVPATLGRQAYLAALARAESETASGRWLFTWGYHGLFHGPISRDDLDALSPERPMVVWHRSFHEVYLNSAALDELGLNNSKTEAHPQVDLAAGHFYENGLSLALEKLTPMILSSEWLGNGLEATRQLIHRGGITTTADMGTGMMTGSVAGDLAIMKPFLGREEIPFRTLLIPVAGDQVGDESLPDTGSEKILHLQKHIKLLADGAFFSQLMQMGPPGYIDGHHGEWLTEPDTLLARAREYWRAGYTLHVHANGDAGIGATLDVLETLLSETPRVDHRFTLHHYGYSTPEQARRVARLGAGVSANPNYLFVLSDRYGEVGLGEDRASQISRLGSVVRAGAPVSLHSDLTMAPSQPLFLAWIAANRLSSSGRLHAPEERLSLDQALRAITTDAAFALRMEDQIGSIRAGKRADFTVLDRDPTRGGREGLRDVRVLETVFGGKPYPFEPLTR